MGARVLRLCDPRIRIVLPSLVHADFTRFAFRHAQLTSHGAVESSR
jgi:hypothetical protein